jgi:tetratricopeptide (TPR) repeat protein/TolB-like protein
MQGFLLEPLYQPLVVEHPFQPDDVLDGRFRIESEIAQGGMGIVYVAWDQKLERRIAIKCAKTGFRKRLPPEVRHAQEISHPNVCKIFEIHTAQTSAGEMDFVTMEYLEGETLAERLKRGAVPEPEARSIAVQLCSGLAAAHSQGVIHGDLKSNNVILTKVADASTRAVITDFGMARATEAAQSTMQSGPRGGTPDYMAPELWKGEKASVSSDVFALGVMLHELVSGRKPVAGERVEAHSKWNPILEKCLRPDPADRYANARHIAQAFEPRPFRRWFLAAAAAVLVAAMTGVVTYRQATAPKEVVRLAMLPFTYSADLAPVAEGVLRETSANLAKIQGGTKARYSAVSMEETQRAKVDTPEKARAQFSATHLLRGTLVQERDRVVVHAFLFDTQTGAPQEWKMEYAPGQMHYIPVAVAGFATSRLLLPALAIPPVNAAANANYLAGVNYVRRDPTVDAALSSCEHAVALDPDSPLTHACLAEAQWYKYYLTKDPQWLDRAQQSARDAERRNPDLAPVHRIVGILNRNAGLYSLAKSDFLRAIELDPANSLNYLRLSQVLEDDGQFEEALVYLKRGLALDPNYYRLHQDLGALYLMQGRYLEALPYFQKMVELEPDVAVGHYAIGTNYMDLGRFAESEREFRRSIELQETPAALVNLGNVLLYQEREGEAVQYYQKVLTRYPERRLAWINLGDAYRRLHRSAESQDAYRRGLAMTEAELARDPRGSRAHSDLAYMCARLGDKGRAIFESAQAFALGQNDKHVFFVGALTYEALGLRDKTLEVLNSAPAEVLADLNRWPDVADLRRDSRFLDLLVSHHVQ